MVVAESWRTDRDLLREELLAEEAERSDLMEGWRSSMWDLLRDRLEELDCEVADLREPRLGLLKRENMAEEAIEERLSERLSEHRLGTVELRLLESADELEPAPMLAAIRLIGGAQMYGCPRRTIEASAPEELEDQLVIDVLDGVDVGEDLGGDWRLLLQKRGGGRSLGKMCGRGLGMLGAGGAG